jgi:hypothetical protein
MWVRSFPPRYHVVIENMREVDSSSNSKDGRVRPTIAVSPQLRSSAHRPRTAAASCTTRKRLRETRNRKPQPGGAASLKLGVFADLNTLYNIHRKRMQDASVLTFDFH